MPDVRTLTLDINGIKAQLAGQLRRLAAAVAAINAKTQRGSATITGPFAVGNTDVTITWPQAWPDAGYSVIISIISGTAAIGSLDASLKVGSKTVNDCAITVANTGAGPVGTFALDVVGIRT